MQPIELYRITSMEAGKAAEMKGISTINQRHLSCSKKGRNVGEGRNRGKLVMGRSGDSVPAAKEANTPCITMVTRGIR